MPSLVLLDLNLPRRDGREVLEDIKNDPQLMHIPVVVLTSSQAEGGYGLTPLGRELCETFLPLHRFAEKWRKGKGD